MLKKPIKLNINESAIQVYQSTTNFLLAKTEIPDFVRKLDDMGIQILDLSDQLSPGFIRVSIGTPEENDAFIKGIHQVQRTDILSAGRNLEQKEVSKMPRGDGTGPSGQGSGTGKGIRRGSGGRGRGGGMGAGPDGSCICPKCGEKVAHQLGTSCFDLKCPKCGATMTRA